MISNYDPTIESKWAPVLEGIDNDYTRKVTAVLLENQAKAIVSERVDEVVGTDAPTTVGKLGTFQKFAFPLVRRVYPSLLANNLVGVQPMQGPVSQIFYLGHDRVHGSSRVQTVFSRYDLTYANLTNSAIDTGRNTGALGANEDIRDSFDTFSATDAALSSLGMSNQYGTCADSWTSPAQPSATMGGKIASFPIAETIIGYSVSAGEALTSTGIPELNMHIDQQPVVARTRKMRALWTLEAAQDLRAYHNLDLEGELTGLLSKEIALEIDREIIEDLRMIAYDPNGVTGWQAGTLTGMQNTNNFGDSQAGVGPAANSSSWAAQAAGGELSQNFTASAFLYDFANASRGTGTGPDAGTNSNVWLVDLSRTDNQFGAAPQHVGQVYSNLLAIINFASQDIYRTTMRGPGNWLVTSPLIASMLESAAKLEGGIPAGDGPTNISRNAIAYKGKFMGRYDLWVDPMYPEDEIMVGYKGDNAMDSGYVYAPYIPLQSMPTITDPADFQPRKGILTRYGKAAVGPYYRFYRIIRVVGAGANYLFNPFGKGGGSDALNSAD